MLYAARSLGLRQVAMMRDLRANDKVLQAFALNPVASQHGTFDYGGTWRELSLLFRTVGRHGRHQFICARDRMKHMARFQTARQDFEAHGRCARMRNRSVNGIRSTWICIALLTLSSCAEAADRGQLGPTSPELKAWANSLDNTLGEACCATADGWKPEEVEYDMKDNNYRVKIEGEWHVVPPYAVIKRPNKFGFPVVWYYKTWLNGIKPSILIRCFIPGAGG